jgi:phosphoglycolate phosphatase
MIRFLREFNPQTIRLLVFDLDGTLIDSRLDLIHSINAMLRHFGRPELPGELIATYVGDGAPVLVQRALGSSENDSIFKEALNYFLAYYRAHKLDHTTVYQGVNEMLNTLRASNNGRPRLMSVLSNKPVNPSRDILRAFKLNDLFVSIYGGNSFATKKPDPLGVQTILKETNVAPEEAIMIGDSAVDVLTGQNAGLWTCGVTYGFAPQTLEETPPDVLIEKPEELEELFRA